MANPESFVSPRRGGGTGAAAILQPSTALKDIFTTYDEQHKQPDDPFLDSLGADIKKGVEGYVGIYEPDRPAIAKARDELTALQAKAFMAKTSYAKHPEVYQAIDNKKQELVDLVSKSQRTRAIDDKTTTEFQNNWHKYDDAQKKKHEEWRNTPIYERSALPDVKPLDAANYQEIAKKWGAKNQQGYYSIANYKDQNGATRSGYVFQEDLARKDWNDLVRTEAGTQNMQRFFGQATEIARNKFEQDGQKWDETPRDIQLQAIDAEAEDMYIEAVRKQTPSKEVKSYMQNTPKENSKATVTPEQRAKMFSISSNIIAGDVVKDVKRIATLNLVGLLGKDKENAEQSWAGVNDENVIGRAQRVIQEEGKPAFIEVSIKDDAGNASFKYVPYQKNSDKVINDYGIDFYKDRPKDFNTKWNNFKAGLPDRDKLESNEEYEKRIAKFKPVIEKYNSRKSSGVGKKDRVKPKNDM